MQARQGKLRSQTKLALVREEAKRPKNVTLSFTISFYATFVKFFPHSFKKPQFYKLVFIVEIRQNLKCSRV